MHAAKIPPTADEPTVGADPLDDDRPQTDAPSTDGAPPMPDARRTAVEDTAGALTGTYRPDELAILREGWPA